MRDIIINRYDMHKLGWNILGQIFNEYKIIHEIAAFQNSPPSAIITDK